MTHCGVPLYRPSSLPQVGMATGATIHTANGLSMRVTRRTPSGGSGSGAPGAAAKVPATV